MCRAEAAVLDEGEEAAARAPRVQRLEVLIRLRKLYRNLLRADGLLAQPSPVYQPYERPGVLIWIEESLAGGWTTGHRAVERGL